MVKRAREVLADLEASRPSGTLDSLPLFSYEPHEPEPKRDDALREGWSMRSIPTRSSPREAQAALYELKRLLDGESP